MKSELPKIIRNCGGKNLARLGETVIKFLKLIDKEKLPETVGSEKKDFQNILEIILDLFKIRVKLIHIQPPPTQCSIPH
jgi:hypothetical protein